MHLSGHFVASVAGSVCTIVRRPSTKPRGCILVLPAFAEEMNKSRRMVAETTQRLAATGWVTVTPDLFGTGDSEGDFSGARISTWQADIQAICDWCAREQHSVTGVLAVRFGAALAVAASASGQLGPIERTVLWQPVLDGQQQLSQFLRLRSLASMMTGATRETVAKLRQSLVDGELLEVAGYRVSSQLALEMEKVCPPDQLPDALGKTAWLEVVRSDGGSSAASSKRRVVGTALTGETVESVRIVGEPFWTTTEVTVVEDLIATTVAAFDPAYAPIGPNTGA